MGLNCGGNGRQHDVLFKFELQCLIAWALSLLHSCQLGDLSNVTSPLSASGSSSIKWSKTTSHLIKAA
jgi:hypothetical protein